MQRITFHSALALAMIFPGHKMSYSKIWIHAVWGTKGRTPILQKETRKQLFNHIQENAAQKKIFIKSINVYVDHVHVLVGLKADMSLSETIQLLKGESAHWANKNQICLPKLIWAKEYFAVSVSESMLGKVIDYINNQEEHHRKKSFSEEYEEFIQKYNFNTHG